MEQEEAETNLQILLDFLHCLKRKKLDELDEIQSDMRFIKQDIQEVERNRIELYRKRERYSAKLRMPVDDPSSKSIWQPLLDKHSSSAVSGTAQCHLPSVGLQNRRPDAKSSTNILDPRKDTCNESDTQNLIPSELAMARKKRVHAQVAIL